MKQQQDDFIVQVENELIELLPGFLKNRKQGLTQMAEMINECDFVGLIKMGHDLRGVPGAFGYDFIVNLGFKIEADAKDGNIELLKTHLQNYKYFLKHHFIQLEGSEKLYRPDELL